MRHLGIPDSDIIETVGFEHTDASPTGGRIGKLTVVFKSSPEVAYTYGCTEREFVTLVTADSIGSTFHEMFKKTKRAFKKSKREQPTLKK